MYLAGFSLTLVFVIARIVELMQATVNAEEESESYKKRLTDREARDAAGVTNGDGEESTLIDDSDNSSGPPGPPGSTPFTLRRRNVSASNGDKDD